MTTTADGQLEGIGTYKFGWSDSDVAGAGATRGINEAVVRDISEKKSEPQWMLDLRLKGLKLFEKKPMPTWGSDLSGIDFDNIKYFVRSSEKQATSWEDLPEDIKNTYDKLGIPEAEKQRLVAGVAAQYECCHPSTRVYTANRGIVAIKEIEPGDLVFSYDEVDERFIVAPVRAAAETGVKQTYAVHTRAGTLRATDNHPVLVLDDDRAAGSDRARYVRRWKTIGELQPGDLVAVNRDVPEFGEALRIPAVHRLERVSAVEPKTSNPQLMWLLGYFLGDGSLQLSGRTARVQFAAPARDTALREEIVRIVKDEFGYEAKVPDDDRVVVNSRALVDWFELAQLGGSAFTKRVPGWVFSLPADQRLAYLAGYLDADGYVAPDGAVRVTSVNSGLLQDIADLAALCGLGASAAHPISSRHPFDRERGMSAFRMTLKGRLDRLPLRNARRMQQFAERWHRGQTYISSKGKEFRAHCTDHLGFSPVLSIELDDEIGVWDIEVDGPHNFIAEGLVVHNSEVVYHSIREDLEDKGVLFIDTDTALKEHPEIFREYFGSVIPVGDNKFAALNTAVWSGGSFIYVPPGVKVDIPLQAYFRINTENMGQFERTLIIADEGSSVHYVEGCTAPIYSSDSLHSAVVEIIVKKDAHVRYTTIQNWSNNVYNLVTKRTAVHEGGRMEWIDGNIGCLAQGSRVTTPGGVKPIEQLSPGEQVLAWDDDAEALCFRTVLGKRYSGEAPVREVRAGQRALRVTDNHPFYSYRYDATAPKKLGRYALGYVRADELTEAIVPISSLDYGRPHKLEQPDLVTVFGGGNQYAAGFRSERRRPARLNVAETTTDDLMWLFGAFTGDGSIDVQPADNGGWRSAKVTFSVPTTDRAHARLRGVMADVLSGVEPGVRADGVACTWSSVELAALLTANGFATGAHDKRVPEWVLSLPESQRLSFVAGYLDTDGCAPRGRRGLSIKSANRELLQGVSDVLTSLGIPSSICTEFDEPRQVQTRGYQSTARAAHRLDLRADARLVALLTPTLREAVAAQPAVAQPHFRAVGRSGIELPGTVEIRKVTVSDHLETVPTWDIEVEGVGNFVSEGFIVHNSKVTMKYPACYLLGERAAGETLSIAFAGEGQHQDAGAKMVHAAPNTTSNIVSKSVARGGGRTSYRGLVQVQEGATGSKSSVVCDALLVDTISRSDTYPYVDVREDDVSLGHEATVSKVGEDQIFYLMSRGMAEDEAMAMVVRGFVEPIARELPMEYALELNRLIELQMEGSVG